MYNNKNNNTVQNKGDGEMKVAEMLAKINEVYDDLANEYSLIGIRFEDKVRVAGEEITECSKSNHDREDERDFPEYGTEEYEKMEEMDGISTWNLLTDNGRDVERVYTGGANSWLWDNLDADVNVFIGKHAYVIVGNRVGNTINTPIDDGELLIYDPVVALVLY